SPTKAVEPSTLTPVRETAPSATGDLQMGFPVFSSTARSREAPDPVDAGGELEDAATEGEAAVDDDETFGVADVLFGPGPAPKPSVKTTTVFPETCVIAGLTLGPNALGIERTSEPSEADTS